MTAKRFDTGQFLETQLEVKAWSLKTQGSKVNVLT
jgi:hypothetical protein